MREKTRARCSLMFLYVHEFAALQLNGVGVIVCKQAAGAEALESAGGGVGAPFGEGGEADVALECGVDPPRDAALLRVGGPALR